MLQGEAKRTYMREYMRKRRAGGVARKPKNIAAIDNENRAVAGEVQPSDERHQQAERAAQADGESRQRAACQPPVTMIAVAGPEPRAPRHTKVAPQPDPAGFSGDNLREYMLTKAKALRAAEKAEPGTKRRSYSLTRAAHQRRRGLPHSSSRSRRTASLAGFFDLSHTFDGPPR